MPLHVVLTVRALLLKVLLTSICFGSPRRNRDDSSGGCDCALRDVPWLDDDPGRTRAPGSQVPQGFRLAYSCDSYQRIPGCSSISRGSPLERLDAKPSPLDGRRARHARRGVARVPLPNLRLLLVAPVASSLGLLMAMVASDSS